MSSKPPRRGRGPDIMIGVLTVALLGGFGFLLLDKNKTSEPVATTPPPQKTASIPTPPATVEPQPVLPTPATNPSEPVITAEPTNQPAVTGTIPPAPSAREVAPITPPTLPSAQSAPSDTTTEQTQPVPQEKASKPEEQRVVTIVPPRAGGAIPTSEKRMPLRTDYRISLGSFSTQKTVQTQTAGVRALGYTIYPIQVGDEYVAQVGPFADEASARRALGDIHRAYPSALLYPPRDAQKKEKSTDDSAQTAETKKTKQPAPKGPRYLQVGAFDRPESAVRLVGILRDAGFAPTVNSPPDAKTTVMVGPYSGQALLRAEERLDRAGLDYFRIR